MVNPFHPNNTPDGYIEIEKLFKNDRHEVAKAKRVSDEAIVVLKKARAITDHFKEVSKLGHEYDILKDLDHNGIPKVYDIVRGPDSVTLIQEFFEGNTLSELLFKGKIESEVILDIGIQLADILNFLHAKGIIHKDINTSNILVDSKGKVKLVDFGISSNMHFEQTESVLIDHIEGTLTNIAPEQTGRTSFSVTQSCDLYSFGILLYELFTGKPPFDSSDPLEIIHFHLSRKPISLSKVTSVPFGVEAIVDKLLEKNPDDRYKSAHGLGIDLKKVMDILKGKANSKDFVLGLDDRIDHYQQPQKLYGRKHELELLMHSYKHLDDYKSLLVLVSGYSGVGKSALVSNIKYPIIQDHGIFISGKFDQFKRNIPYFGFIQAFQEFIQTLLSEPDERIDYWNEKISYAIGKNGALITEVIPQLTRIIGKQDPVPKLQPAEQEARFNMVLLDFVYAFTSARSPLVIFLDDLQWADHSSLSLITSILNNPRKEGVMLIGAFRDNEVDAAHPLKITLNQLEIYGAYIHEINLKPLTEKTTMKITADSFGMDESTAESLGKLVYRKTKGNPFFINRFLKSLYDNELLVKDTEGIWNWDQNVIDGLEFTDNVIDLMISDIGNLPAGTQNSLKMAAVLGNTFNLHDLSTILKRDVASSFKDLRPAIQSGYVTPIDKNYRGLILADGDEGLTEQARSANFKFTHDKVQQAAYGLISDQEREHVHLRTGRLLHENLSQEEQSEQVFELLNHFDVSLRLLEDEAERLEIIKLCLIAGKKAKESTSYNLAVKYLDMGRLLLGKASWDIQYDLTFDLFSELGECEYLNNNPVRAEQIFHQVLERAKTRFEKLKIYYVHSSLYLKKSSTSESLRIGMEAVALYDVKFPKSKLAIQLKAMVQLMKYLWLFSTKYRNPESLFNLEDCEDEEIIMLNKFLIDLATSAYQQDQNLMMLVIFKILSSYLKNGFTDASGWGFSGISVVVLSVIKMQKTGFDLWDVTTRLHQRTHSPLIKWRLGYTVNAFYLPWRNPIRDGFDDNLEIVKACVLNGDQIFTGYTIAMHLRMRWFAGTPLDTILEESEKFVDLLRNNQGGYEFFVGHYQLVRAINGLTSSGDWDDDDFSGDETYERFSLEGNRTKLAFFSFAKLPMLYFLGHYQEALLLVNESGNLLENVPGDILEFEYAFYSNLIISANYKNFNNRERKRYGKMFKKNMKRIAFWVKGCSYNFNQHYHLLLAEEAAMNGRIEPALKLYEEAMNLASRNGFMHIEAIANERAALYSLEHQFRKQAEIYLKDTWQKYHEWGAYAKCRLLEFSHPSMLKATGGGHTPEQHIRLTTHTSMSSKVALDLASLLKASQSIASQVHYDDLLKNLMRITIENAGAEKGCVILAKEAGLMIEAVAHAERLEAELLDSVLVSQSDIVPVSIVNYCWRTKESIIVENAQIDERFNSDPVTSANAVQSVMCLPITEKGNSIGLLYLENNLMKGAFTKERLEVMQMLSGQIGISIENALLYENLEEKVQERTIELEKQKLELEKEKEKSEELLLNILPKETAFELRSTGKSEAKSFSSATVMFCDIVDFTKLGENLEATELVTILHELFSGIDAIIKKKGIEKIKTIGDAYLCATGLKEGQNGQSAKDMVYAAIEIMKLVEKMNSSETRKDRPSIQLRIGIHNGPVVAGVVGTTKFAYDIWGDTVNLAARMETHSVPMSINISQEMYQIVGSEFKCEHRGKVDAKNKGLVDMYFVKY